MRPTASGRACRTLFQKAPTVWPDRVRPEGSVIVPEMMTGRREAQLLEQRLDREDGGLGVERVEDGLDEQEVDAAVHEATGRLVVGRHELLEVTLRAPGSFTSGDSDAVRLVGPRLPATKRGRRRIGGLVRRPRPRVRGGPPPVHLRDQRLEGVVGHARCAVALKVFVVMMSAPAAR